MFRLWLDRVACPLSAGIIVKLITLDIRRGVFHDKAALALWERNSFIVPPQAMLQRGNDIIWGFLFNPLTL